MAIDFECSCGKKLKAKDEAAGKRTKCPQCGALLTVPQLAAAAKKGGAAPVIADDGDLPLALDSAEPMVKIETISSATSLDAVPAAPPTEHFGQPLEAGTTRQYKVLAPKDMGFIAKFDPAKLEETLNLWARQGWTLRSTVVQTHQAHGSVHHDLLVIMEREPDNRA